MVCQDHLMQDVCGGCAPVAHITACLTPLLAARKIVAVNIVYAGRMPLGTVRCDEFHSIKMWHRRKARSVLNPSICSGQHHSLEPSQVESSSSSSAVATASALFPVCLLSFRYGTSFTMGSSFGELGLPLTNAGCVECLEHKNISSSYIAAARSKSSRALFASRRCYFFCLVLPSHPASPFWTRCSRAFLRQCSSFCHLPFAIQSRL